MTNDSQADQPETLRDAFVGAVKPMLPAVVMATVVFGVVYAGDWSAAFATRLQGIVWGALMVVFYRGFEGDR